MKLKFAVASYEILLFLSDRPSQLNLAAEVKDYFRSSELNLHRPQPYIGLFGLISVPSEACLVAPVRFYFVVFFIFYAHWLNRWLSLSFTHKIINLVLLQN